jgi:hypothetical protein
LWSSVALLASVAWMLLTALTIDTAPIGIGPLPHADIAANLMFAFASTAACLGFAAVFLRFAGRPWPFAQSLSDNAYGIYLTHYPFIVWLQYMLLGGSVLAVAKGAIVSGGSLFGSWIAVIALRRTSLGAFLIGAGPSVRLAQAGRRAIDSQTVADPAGHSAPAASSSSGSKQGLIVS